MKGRICGLLSVMLPLGCGIQVAGDGPVVLGPDGGRAGSGDPECHAILDVPSGALERNYEIDIECDEVEVVAVEGFYQNSPVYELAPLDVNLAAVATFDLGYEMEGENRVVWSGPTETKEWMLLSTDALARTWSNGTKVIRFEHDAFGYFALLRPTSEDI
jgi:hypothetical protein